MISPTFRVGLSEKEVSKIIRKHLNQNADLLIGIDDPEMTQLLDVLVEGVSKAIQENNEEIEEQLEDVIKEVEEIKEGSRLNSFQRRW